MTESERYSFHKKLPVLPDNPESTSRGRFPSWLHRTLPKGAMLPKTATILQEHKLSTVCEEAKCPNRFECYSKKTATFLVLGHECTRACGFCDIDFSKAPMPPDPEEPERIALAVKDLGLKHVVITMVARDDLADHGSHHLVKIMRCVRERHPTCTLELLTSDFGGDFEAIDRVLDEAPEVFNYNIETTRSLTPRVRHTATYDRTLSILKHAKKRGVSRFVKSGLMLGLGESTQEVKEALRDLVETGVDIVTMGQYLQPSRKKLPVKAFIHPDQFASFAAYGESIGIPHVYAGPFVRSSYNADLILEKNS